MRGVTRAALGSVLFFLVAPAVAVVSFVAAYEQPTLRRTYGPSYDAYCRRVPAVVPRLRQRTRSTQAGPSDS